MSRFAEVFGHEKVFLPVIHVQDTRQTLENVKIAKNEGADGVFLINHESRARTRSPSDRLLGIFSVVHERYPKFWIGLNFLDQMTQQAVYTVPKAAMGLWADNAHLSDDVAFEDARAIKYGLSRRKERDWAHGLYFGGIAFKGQPSVADEDLEHLVRNAISYGVDVLTTSGSSTGFAPSVKKMALIHSAAHGHPIANASGMTTENVADYVPYVDCFMVASGIGKDFYNLDPDKVHAFKRKISY